MHCKVYIAESCVVDLHEYIRRYFDIGCIEDYCENMNKLRGEVRLLVDGSTSIQVPVKPFIQETRVVWKRSSANSGFSKQEVCLCNDSRRSRRIRPTTHVVFADWSNSEREEAMEGKSHLEYGSEGWLDSVPLNSMLLKGPELLTPLFSVMFTYRERLMTASPNIKEMFLQIAIRQLCLLNF